MSFEELADCFFKMINIHCVIIISDNLIEDDVFFPRTVSSITYVKGNPITKAGLVVFNDKDENYTERLTQILLSYNCFNIAIEPMVSYYGRKFFLATFDVKCIDINSLSNKCIVSFNEETLSSVNRNNDIYYNEFLLDRAMESSKPSNYEWQIVQSKNAYYDLSDDDSSLDNRFW